MGGGSQLGAMEYLGPVFGWCLESLAHFLHGCSSGCPLLPAHSWPTWGHLSGVASFTLTEKDAQFLSLQVMDTHILSAVTHSKWLWLLLNLWERLSSHSGMFWQLFCYLGMSRVNCEQLWLLWIKCEENKSFPTVNVVQWADSSPPSPIAADMWAFTV